MQADLQLSLAMIANARWMRTCACGGSATARSEMTRLAGPIDYASNAADGNGHHGRRRRGPGRAAPSELVQGRTNREIAEEIGIDEQAVTRRLGELFARIGASSRAEATALAFRQRVL